MIDSNGDEIERLYTKEATDTLYDEVEALEKELFAKEARLVCTEQNLITAELTSAAFEELIDEQQEELVKAWGNYERRTDQLHAAEESAKKRNRYIGVALGAAFLLGVYLGLLGRFA